VQHMNLLSRHDWLDLMLHFISILGCFAFLVALFCIYCSVNKKPFFKSFHVLWFVMIFSISIVAGRYIAK